MKATLLTILLFVPAICSFGQESIANPVLDQNFPDPTVIRAGDKYYAYATNSRVNGKDLHIQVASSADRQHWKIIGDALPQKPSWASADFWAPHVLYDSSLGKYVLFYSGESNDTTTGKCLGVAFSDHPEGPFTDKGSPLICGDGFRNIDPFAFIDPETGKKLLYWGSDFQPVRVQEMTDDWTAFKSGTSPKPLVWPGKEKSYDRLIEGSWVDYHDGKYYLYYSGDNCCGAEAHYAVMVARAEQAEGPFTRYGEVNGTGSSFVLQKNGRWLAPGHNSVFKDDEGNRYIAYHAIPRDEEGNAQLNKGRVFCISPLAYKDGWPVVEAGDIKWGQTVLVSNVQAGTASGKPSGNRSAYGSEYGRMLRLANGNWLAGYTVSRNRGYREDPDGGLELEIAESTDNGRHWKKIALITDKGRDLDNTQLIRLPDGSILLACRSVRWQESYRLPVYRSTDNGRSWKRIGIIDSNEGKPGELGHPDKGIYEPHFHLLDDGRLAVMYANEKHVTDSISYSQIISEKVSSNKGKTWGKEIWVAYAPGHHASRPGMPVWTRMKNGRYMAVYEVCGPEKCNVYYKTSEDGVTWPVGLGTVIPDQTGGPYILSLDDGRLVVTSNKANISVSGDYGVTWHTTAPAWEHKKPFAEDWVQTIWNALYQTGPDEIATMSSVERTEGGHNIQLRFGKINKRHP